MKQFATLGLAVLLLSACAVSPHDIGREPRMTPLGAGLKKTQITMPVAVPDQPQTRGISLWQDASADLFRDGRARNIGDVVTIRIAINDKASLDNSSNRSRDSKLGLAADMKYSLSMQGVSANGTGGLGTDLSSNTSSKGTGSVARSESINLLVAAVVTGILPNGNLIVSGSQEVRVNYEMRVLTVAGVIRPRDIAASNQISYEKIAEARISYGGRGRLSEIQQPAVGQQILDIITPF